MYTILATKYPSSQRFHHRRGPEMQRMIRSLHISSHLPPEAFAVQVYAWAAGLHQRRDNVSRRRSHSRWSAHSNQHPLMAVGTGDEIRQDLVHLELLVHQCPASPDVRRGRVLVQGLPFLARRGWS